MKHLFGLLTAALLILSSCADPCSDTVCMNDGVCTEGICECTYEYSGTDCADESRVVMSGTYIGTSTTTFGPLTDTIVISISGTNVSDITIDDAALATYMLGQNISGELATRTTFTIPTQTIQGTEYSGSATAEDGELALSMIVVTPNNTINVAFTGTKQ